MPLDVISYALAKKAMRYPQPLVPDWEVLAEVEVTSDVDYVEFTGLDINSDKVYVMFMSMKNPLSVNTAYMLFVEGDTDPANYSRMNMYGTGTSAGSDSQSDSEIGAANAGEDNIIFCVVMRDPDGYMRALSVWSRGTTSPGVIAVHTVQKTATVTNITSIRIASTEAGGIGAGSKFILARVKRS